MTRAERTKTTATPLRDRLLRLTANSRRTPFLAALRYSMLTPIGRVVPPRRSIRRALAELDVAFVRLGRALRDGQ